MLYIIRHGQTDWNALKKLQGRVDVPLNEKGREMARQARDEYKNVHFDICYCSPLKRARETAEILLSGRDVPIITDDRLREMSFGIYEGIRNSFDNAESEINTLFFTPEKYTSPVEDGESLDELFARTGEFLKTVVEPQLESGKDVLIVGHGAMNSSIVCRIKGLPIKDFWSAGIENCKLMRLL